ncbi:MAG: hypothetical protein ACM3UU_09115 [Ignavibacteriales bacterium]
MTNAQILESFMRHIYQKYDIGRTSAAPGVNTYDYTENLSRYVYRELCTQFKEPNQQMENPEVKNEVWNFVQQRMRQYGKNDARYYYIDQGESYKHIHLKFDDKPEAPVDQKIKIYIPTAPSSVGNSAKQIWDFVIKNRINTNFKMTHYDRPDNLIFRVDSLEDAQKICDFCQQNNQIRQGMISSPPQIPNINGIGIVRDRYKESYNGNIANQIADYLVRSQGSISLDGLINHVNGKINPSLPGENWQNYDNFIALRALIDIRNGISPLHPEYGMASQQQRIPFEKEMLLRYKEINDYQYLDTQNNVPVSKQSDLGIKLDAMMYVAKVGLSCGNDISKMDTVPEYCVSNALSNVEALYYNGDNASVDPGFQNAETIKYYGSFMTYIAQSVKGLTPEQKAEVVRSNSNAVMGMQYRFSRDLEANNRGIDLSSEAVVRGISKGRGGLFDKVRQVISPKSNSRGPEQNPKSNSREPIQNTPENIPEQSKALETIELRTSDGRTVKIVYKGKDNIIYQGEPRGLLQPGKPMALDLCDIIVQNPNSKPIVYQNFYLDLEKSSLGNERFGEFIADNLADSDRMQNTIAEKRAKHAGFFYMKDGKPEKAQSPGFIKSIKEAEREKQNPENNMIIQSGNDVVTLVPKKPVSVKCSPGCIPTKYDIIVNRDGFQTTYRDMYGVFDMQALKGNTPQDKEYQTFVAKELADKERIKRMYEGRERHAGVFRRDSNGKLQKAYDETAVNALRQRHEEQNRTYQIAK